MKKTHYTSPVSKLLTYGEPYPSGIWPNYRTLGLTENHIPELITMLTDETLHNADLGSNEVWAPLHAWRVLGQLQAVEAIPALLGQLFRIDENGDDWMSDELPEVFAFIGPSAIPGLTQYLADSKCSLFARICAANSLALIGEDYPENCEDCISALEGQLKQYFFNDFTLNGFIVSYLLDLEAVETLPTIRKAFRDECVDLTVAGDCEDVEIVFGVRDERSTPRPPLWPLWDDDDDYDDDEFPLFDILSAPEKLTPRTVEHKIGRNDPCPCGSGKKYKKCCMNKKDANHKESESGDIPRCGLCGNTTNLTKTPCCGQWICDDEDEYVLFSYAHNSCFRNHQRYTLCGHHFNEGHSGRWQDCGKCRENFETELYVYYGTNEYNFEKLENPPSFEPKKCANCGNKIDLGHEGYSIRGKEYWCEKCSNENFFKNFPE